jgi:hypothetical protein
MNMKGVIQNKIFKNNFYLENEDMASSDEEFEKFEDKLIKESQSRIKKQKYNNLKNTDAPREF